MECGIHVRDTDGEASRVKLRIRRNREALAANDKIETPKAPAAQDSVGVTRDYLDHHQLQQRIQSLIQDVLREQPDDPYRYTLEQLRRSQAAKGAEPVPTETKIETK